MKNYEINSLHFYHFITDTLEEQPISSASTPDGLFESAQEKYFILKAFGYNPPEISE